LAAKVAQFGLQGTHLGLGHDNLQSDPARTNNPSFELRSTKGRVIGWGSDAKGLGDLIYLTPICHAFPGEVIVQIPTKSERFAFLFDGIATVQLLDPPYKSPHIGAGHYITRMLRAMGKPEASVIPKINVSPADAEKGRELLAPYPNPLILAVNCAAHWKAMREFDPAVWQEIVDRIKDRYTIIQTGLSSNFTPLRGTVQMLDIPVRDMTGMYHVAGRYLGVDTGDLFLTVAAGGRGIAVVPPSNPYYDHAAWHLRPEHWPGRPRILYLPAAQMRSIPDLLGFLEPEG
jgi:hypothetical protein